MYVNVINRLYVIHSRQVAPLIILNYNQSVDHVSYLRLAKNMARTETFQKNIKIS